MKRLLSIVLTLSLLYLLFSTILDDWESVVSIPWNASYLSLFLLLLGLLSVYIVNVVSWHYATKLVGAKVAFPANARVWLMSNLARLLPGGIWQYPSRVILLYQEGVSKSKGSFAVLIEVLLTLSMGAFTICVTLPFWKVPTSHSFYSSLIVFFLFIPLIILILLTNEKSINYLISLVAKITKRGINTKAVTLHTKYLPHNIVLFALRFVVIGIVFYFFVNTFYPMSLNLLMSIIGMYSLSWIAGFIVIFAPGGIGVTESVLANLLSIYIPFTVAASFALIYRVLIMLTEALLVTVVYTMQVFSKSKKR